MHKQKHANRENEAKMFAKSSKIAIEMELDRVLGALLIQTSITNASQVIFFPNFGCPKGAFWESKRSSRAFFIITKDRIVVEMDFCFMLKAILVQKML